MHFRFHSSTLKLHINKSDLLPIVTIEKEANRCMSLTKRRDFTKVGVGSVAECKDELNDGMSTGIANNMIALTKAIAGSFRPLCADNERINISLKFLANIFLISFVMLIWNMRYMWPYCKMVINSNRLYIYRFLSQ